MGQKDLQAFINAKKMKAEEEEKIDWNQKKEEWLKHLEKLYSTIKGWIEDFENNEAISIEYKEVDLNEEHIGIYKSQEMIIRIADEQVLLDPIGTLLIGAKGRVDMKGKSGTVKIVLVPKEVRGPSIKVEITVGDEQKKTEGKMEVPKEWIWKIATPPPAIKYIELDNDSFSDALLEVIGG